MPRVYLDTDQLRLLTTSIETRAGRLDPDRDFAELIELTLVRLTLIDAFLESVALDAQAVLAERNI